MAKKAVAVSMEKLLAQHKQLQALISELSQFLEKPRPPIGADTAHKWAVTLVKQLRAFDQRLSRHFRAEEGSGFFQEVSGRYPRAVRRVDKLRREHDRLLGDLGAVLAAAASFADGKRPPNPRLRRWIANLLGQLARHERTESELIQRLHTEDIGLGE